MNAGGPATQAERLARFFVAWRNRSPRAVAARRLREFFARAKPLLLRNAPRPPASPPDAGRVQRMFRALRQPLQEQRAAGGMLNPWTASGLEHMEVRNAAVLWALWSPQSCGPAATNFLASFLRLAAPETGAAEALANGYAIHREHRPLNDEENRIDLVVETPAHIIVIEVKIKAPPDAGQLTSYWNLIHPIAERRGKRAVLILLSDMPLQHPLARHVQWETVRRAAAASLPRQRRDWSRTHHLIADFARHTLRFKEHRRG